MRGRRQRRPTRVAWTLGALSLLVLAARVQAETLQDAWLAALAGNARVRAAQARADAALAEFDAAEAARWPAVAVLIPAIYWAKELPDLAVLLLIVAFSLWAGYALWLVLAQHRIGAGVVRLIAGIAIYDALVVAGAGGSATALIVCLAAFAATIALQTKIAGT